MQVLVDADGLGEVGHRLASERAEGRFMAGNPLDGPWRPPTAAAASAAKPSMAMRTVVSSRNPSSDMTGTRTARFGVTSSARSATRRLTASRTGIMLVPSASAVARSEILSPGASRRHWQSTHRCP